ncbi:MAG: ribbon-helix-helix domain-containing protein [Cyanobacteriota bacterium]
MRRPQRICITVSFATYQSLQERSLREGRSLSNLAAFLLEKQLQLPLDPGQGPATR